MAANVFQTQVYDGQRLSRDRLEALLRHYAQAIQALQRAYGVPPLSVSWEVGIPQHRIDLPPGVVAYAVRSQTDDLLKCVPYADAKLPGSDAPQVYDPGLGLEYLYDEAGDVLLDEHGQPLHDESKLSAPAVWVAKPYLLQQKPWDGQTVTLGNVGHSYTYAKTGHSTRDATDELAVVTHQVVWPDYFPGDVILAAQADTGYQDPDEGLDVIWMDLNDGARAWITLCPS